MNASIPIAGAAAGVTVWPSGTLPIRTAMPNSPHLPVVPLSAGDGRRAAQRTPHKRLAVPLNQSPGMHAGGLEAVRGFRPVGCEPPTTIAYLSVCSGIESATLAWHAFGWRPVGFAEIDKFASRVLRHHYPDVRNFGDFTAIDLAELGPVDLLVGGTPCQSFSVAGKRLSLADARGNLSLAYTVLAHELARSHGLRWAVWENVPGVLSTGDNAYGCFLGALVGHDGAIPAPRGSAWPDAGMVAGPWARCAWRVFDAQYFGLAQRRSRVFVVAGFGDGPDPAAVLFEPQGVRLHPPTRGEAAEDVAGTIAGGARSRGGYSHDDVPLTTEVAGTLGTRSADHPSGVKSEADFLVGAERRREDDVNLISHVLPIDLRQASRGEKITNNRSGGTGGGAPGHGVGNVGDPAFTVSERGQAVAGLIAFYAREDCVSGPIPGALGIAHPQAQAIAFQESESGFRLSGTHAALDANNGSRRHNGVLTGWAVRRLMPIETERLQGIPDGYTAIPGAADGPRYKTHGNAMAVNCMRWIGHRISLVDAARATQ